MPVFLLMQVAQREREWSSLTGKRRGKPTTIYCLCLGSFCNEMACVMEALSKQWAYSTWRGVTVRTRLNTIPLIQGSTPLYYFLLCLLSLLLFSPPLFLSLTLSPLIFCCLSSLFSSSLDLSLRKVFETHCGRVFNHIFVHISVEAILVLCITIQYFVLLRFFGICSFSSLGNLNQLKTI